MMIRYVFSAVAAAVMTFGTVSALQAETPKVTVNPKNGLYCVRQDAVTGSRLAISECHSVGEWADMGVTFRKAPAK